MMPDYDDKDNLIFEERQADYDVVIPNFLFYNLNLSAIF